MSAQKTTKKQLWLKVTQGDMRTVGSPRQLRDFLRVHTEQRLVALDRVLLSWGAFGGRSKACHFRLQSLHDAAPQFCLRLDGQQRFLLHGLGGSVFVNGDLLGEDAIALNQADQIICDPYIFKVVPRPDRSLFVQQPKPPYRPETAPMSMSDTNFVLNLPLKADRQIEKNDSEASAPTSK